MVGYMPSRVRCRRASLVNGAVHISANTIFNVQSRAMEGPRMSQLTLESVIERLTKIRELSYLLLFPLYRQFISRRVSFLLYNA